MGLWKDVEYTGRKDKYHARIFRGVCKYCGYVREAPKSQLRTTKKCAHYKTGIKDKRLSKIYIDIKNRCYKPENKAYRWYGAREIKICDEWLENPKSFEKWAIENGYKDNLTIDRINPNENYCPENCRWVTGTYNAKYKSTTRIISVDGISKTGSDWAVYLGVGRNLINKYVRIYGEEKTKEFIHFVLTNGIPDKQKTKISYLNQCLEYQK